MIRIRLDELVAAGLATGYTVEEDAAYLTARRPTLTYRMYSDRAASHRNLGEFAAAMAELGAAIRLSRVEGVMPRPGSLAGRTRQLCLTAEFTSQAALHAAAALVQRRFTASRAAAPGSWRLPDVRISGAEPPGTVPAYAHQWRAGRATAVLLTLSPLAPLAGARTSRVRIMRSWLEFLGRASDPLGSSWKGLVKSA